MAEYRRYTKREKAVAVAAAVASSTLAAAERAGVPESTVRYWVNSPEFAEIRDKARAEIAPLATTAAYLAWVETIELLRQHKLEPHDVIFLTGLATDKAQLLNGAATSRTETRALTSELDDEAKARLRHILYEASLENDSDLSEGSDSIGDRPAEVRE